MVVPQDVDPWLREALNRGTSLELFQLCTVIERLPTDSRRILAIRTDLHLGQTVRFLDWRDGQMRRGLGVPLKDTQLTPHEDGSRRGLSLPYPAVEPPPVGPSHEPRRSRSLSMRDRRAATSAAASRSPSRTATCRPRSARSCASTRAPPPSTPATAPGGASASRCSGTSPVAGVVEAFVTGSGVLEPVATNGEPSDAR